MVKKIMSLVFSFENAIFENNFWFEGSNDSNSERDIVLKGEIIIFEWVWLENLMVRPFF